MIPDMTGKRDPAVLVAGLRMSFGGTEVLRGVEFDVRYGEVFCLLGPNGAGKTTTLEILEGFRPPAGGTASVLGLNPATQAPRLRERVGMVLQECGFPRQARVAELIEIWRGYYPNPRPLGELLDVVELAEVRNTQVRKLSGGRPGSSVPRRADHRFRPGGAPALLGGDREPASAGYHDRAHHPLPGRGRMPGRPGSRSCVRAGSNWSGPRVRWPPGRAWPPGFPLRRPRRCAAARSPCPTGSAWLSAARCPSATPTTPR